MANNKKDAKKGGKSDGKLGSKPVKEMTGSNPLSALINKINKDIGAGTVIVGDAPVANVKFVSTGIATLDAVTGGGMPRGRIVEIYGIESCGKTTTALEIIASCQRTFYDDLDRHGVCAFIDAEHAIDPVWAGNVGVDMSKLLVTQPSNGEEAFQVVEMMAESGQVDLIVVDSVAAMVPKDELDGEVTDNPIGVHARLMSKGLRRLAPIVNRSKTVVVFINQIRQKIGVMFGSPETTSGGLALKFYSSVRMELRRGDTIKEAKTDKAIAITCKAKIVKNKVAPPFKKCDYAIYFGYNPEGSDTPVYGVDKVGCLFDAALLHGIISQSSSHFYFDELRLGNGRDNSVATLAANTELAAAVSAALAEAVAPRADVNMAAVNDDEFDENLGADSPDRGDVEDEEAGEDLTKAV